MLTSFEQDEIRQLIREEIALDEMRRIDMENRKFGPEVMIIPPANGILSMVSRSPIHMGYDPGEGEA